ncbi:FAR1 DNA binding domain, zinc finger, SWIM-type, MULE transposase domain containing protein, partial [Tanacetum coccineum]
HALNISEKEDVIEDIPMEETSSGEPTTEDESSDEEQCRACQVGILDETSRGSKYWIPDVEDKPVEAKLVIKLIIGNQYVVDKFVQRHNHYLVDKENLQILKSCRKLTFSQKVLIHQISNLNMGPVRGFELMKEMYGGFENIGATVTDCKNERSDMNVFLVGVMKSSSSAINPWFESFIKIHIVNQL